MLNMVDYGTIATYSSNGFLISTFIDDFLPEDQNFDPTDTWAESKKDKISRRNLV